MLSTMETYRPRKFKIYINIRVESVFLVNNSQFLRLDRKNEAKRPPYNSIFNPFAGFLAITRHHVAGEAPG